MAEQFYDWNAKWQQLVAETWEDADLKARLLSDPNAVFEERGMLPPAGISVKVLDNSGDTIHLVLPAAPSDYELSEEELEYVSGGSSPCGRCSARCSSRCTNVPTRCSDRCTSQPSRCSSEPSRCSSQPTRCSVRGGVCDGRGSTLCH
ncbi:NHLP leader peptide family RiPP precursor [Lignipirellula cremea]|uniref:Nitrile hydratase, alpha chain n=1 Tax=Lignipirellula cremea TaxID=2528010 RepID=A0A518DQN5_9BACT|nr:Nitrile hydratase, alpha chain [Lignipirellula cremea]